MISRRKGLCAANYWNAKFHIAEARDLESASPSCARVQQCLDPMDGSADSQIR
jgi:hypothetical protein